jgi:hypothetical protein
VRISALAVLVLAVGCGEATHATTQQARAHQPAKTCERAAPAFRTCFQNGRDLRPTIERMTASGWAVVTGPLKHADPDAMWRPKIWVSPDADTSLAEWDFPCDSAVAVFVPMRGGSPRVVTGQLDWRKAPISRPLGWTRDGKARVRVFGKRGVQLIDPSSVRRLRVKPTRC